MPYPISDHFDGELFFNPEPTVHSGTAPAGKRLTLFSFIRARLSRDSKIWAAWPKHIENKHYALPLGEVAAGSVQLTFIGHSSFLIRLPRLTVLTDPVFSKRCSPVPGLGPSRVRAPGIALANLPQIDLVLLSHNHYDHMDISSLRKLRKRFPAMKIVTMLGNADYLAGKRISGAVELDWWQAYEFDKTKVTATPARHFAARSLYDRNKALWGGLYLEHEGEKIYFAGDSGYTKFFAEVREKLGAPDLALLPIGAYEPRWFMQSAHMNPADAVMAFQDLSPRQVVGMHFGTFQLTAEPIDQPEKDLAVAKAAAALADDTFITLDCGETRLFLLE